jgi:cation transport ATPase
VRGRKKRNAQRKEHKETKKRRNKQTNEQTNKQTNEQANPQEMNEKKNNHTRNEHTEMKKGNEQRKSNGQRKCEETQNKQKKDTNDHKRTKQTQNERKDNHKMKERTNKQKLVIHFCGFQSAPLVSRLALAKWLCQLRPCVVSLWFIDVVIFTCWENVGTTCVPARTTRKEREVIGLHLLAFSSATFRCQCESSRIQHFVPLGANANFSKVSENSRRVDCG